LNLLKRIYKHRYAYFFLLPHFVFFLIFFLLPVGNGVYLSLFDYNVFSKTFIGIENYREIFSDWLFRKALLNTFIYTFGVVPLWLGKALLVPFSFILFESRSRRSSKRCFTFHTSLRR